MKLSATAKEALIALVAAPLIRRGGRYIHASALGNPDARAFKLETISRLSKLGAIVHVARPGEYSVRLSAHGRIHASLAMAAEADAITDSALPR